MSGDSSRPHENILVASLAFAALAVLLVVLVWLWPSTFFLRQGGEKNTYTPPETLDEATKDEIRAALIERLRAQDSLMGEEEKQRVREQLVNRQETSETVLSESEKEKVRAQLITP